MSIESIYRRAIARTIRVGSCLEFTGSKDKYGYGQIRSGNKLHYTHRLACEILHGPSALFALHSCDNPACMEPTHLSWGTHSRNQREARDRLNNHATQKLTREQAEYVKNSPRTHGSGVRLAKELGVSPITISHIRTGRQWADV